MNHLVPLLALNCHRYLPCRAFSLYDCSNRKSDSKESHIDSPRNRASHSWCRQEFELSRKVLLLLQHIHS